MCMIGYGTGKIVLKFPPFCQLNLECKERVMLQFPTYWDLNFPQAFSRINSYNLLAVSKKYDHKPQEKNRLGSFTKYVCNNEGGGS